MKGTESELNAYLKTASPVAEIAWPELPFKLDARSLMLVMRRGSEAHGLWIPPNEPMGTDDRDIMAVVLPPPSYILGLDSWKQTVEKITGQWDVVVYDFRHFIRLLVKQNPNVVGMLWLEAEDYLHVSPLGQRLLKRRMVFRDRDLAYQSFVEYARDQLADMDHKSAGYMGEKRKALVEKFGYDTKHIAHCIRLLRMGAEFLSNGQMKVKRTYDREELLDIKQGRFTREDVQAMAHAEFARIETARQLCQFESLDIGAASAICEDILRSHLEIR